MEFSVKEMVLIVAFLALLLGAAVYSLVSFKDLKTEQNRMTASIQSLKAELAEREDRIAKLTEKFAAQQDQVMIVGRGDTTAVSPASNNGEVKIEDLEVKKLERSLSLSFRLVNNSQKEQMLNGYLMVIVEHKSGEYDKFGTFPVFTLASGQPIDYHEGDTYSIRNFKLVNARIPLADQPEQYSKMKVLVFSEAGEILLYDNRVLEW